MAITTPAPAGSDRARAWGWGTLAALIVIGLLAAPAWWWRSHPTAFVDAHLDLGTAAGGEYDLAHGPFRVEVADPLVRYGTARMDEVEPVVVTNTAEARITFSVCTRKPRAGESFGGPMEDLTRFCSEVVPLEAGYTLPLGHHTGLQVTMSIDPAHAGTVKVAGVRVTYEHGMQYGTQVVSNSISVRFVDSSDGGG